VSNLRDHERSRVIAGPRVRLWNSGSRKQVGGYAVVTAIALVVFAITLVAMRGAARLSAVLGRSGVDAIGRLIGIIVSAIAIQLVVDGIGELTKAAIH
jgi:small neutral amino acid transporter SnatA (MarC family)